METGPSGPMTFLFTDIEGSTRILTMLGAEAYAEVLVAHQRLIRTAVGAHRGRVVDSQGDAFLVAFERPGDAIDAAAAARQALAEHVWPTGAEIRVRMGIHTADALPTSEGYVGVGVHQGARICAAGHGGQILVSQVTRDLITEELAEDAFVDLGEHRLKDLTAPVRLFQVATADGHDRFPPLRTLETRPVNLPVQATTLVGRERELEDIVALLSADDVRCVTLTGPGGIGKTRLALAAAAESSDGFRDGVCFVPLSALTDPALVIGELTQQLGVNESAGQDLQAYLATKQMLLVVDNLEQVVDAAKDLADVLAGAPGVRLLTTSREPLYIAAERVYPVAPLSLPSPKATNQVEAIAGSDAVVLFVERARSVDPSFQITATNAAAIAAICTRLDGVALALELAAARTSLLSPAEILARLDRPFELLRGGRRDAPDRHRALERTLAWSHELLDDEQRRLFAWLSVFAGDFDLEAAEAVAGAAIETLDSLVRKSLVRRVDERFAMLETIRSYALDQLALAGDEEAARDRHATFFETRAVKAYDDFIAHRSERADELERDRDNLRAALDRLAEVDPQRFLRMSGKLGWFWHVHSHMAEGRARLASALVGASGRDADRALALSAAGALAGYQGQLDSGRPMFEASLDIWRELGDQRGLWQALFDLGWASFYADDDRTALDSFRECLEISERMDEPALVNLSQLGVLQILISMGDLDGVPELGEQAIELSRGLGDPWAEHFAHHFLADCSLILGDPATAAAHYARSLEAAVKSGDRLETCWELLGRAMSAAGLGDAERALQIAGAVDAELGSLGFHGAVRFWDELQDRYIGHARATLGARAAQVWEDGRRLPFDVAIEEASAT